ncbi:MAG TPA: hypothetical protein VNJ11_01140 [Bryobacteraceae bacterium]|nr:hypothetical protein [Bryobacteraceae bacterium]
MRSSSFIRATIAFPPGALTLFAASLAFPSQSLLAQASAAGGPSASGVSVTVRIDGSTDPQRIPEAVAWLHFFGVIARDPSLDEALDRRRRLAYLTHFFNKAPGPQTGEDRSLSEIQMDALLSAADAVLAQLRQTTRDADRERIVTQAAASLEGALGLGAAAAVRRHVNEHVRRHIRILDFSMPAPGARQAEARR